MDPQADPNVQAKLDGLISRVDEEMARAASEYQDARTQLADHHAKMDAQATGQQAKLDKLRERLEPVVFGDKAPGAGFDRQREQYLEAAQALGDTRTARRMAFPATLPPGTLPTGAPLGTAPPK